MSELPYELPNSLRLRILRNYEISRESQKRLNLMASSQSATLKPNFDSCVKKLQNIWCKNSKEPPIYLIICICLKYFDHDCRMCLGTRVSFSLTGVIYVCSNVCFFFIKSSITDQPRKENVSFLYPLKTPENQRFSATFLGQKMKTFA